MWSTMALNESQISQQIAAASKRDGSIMVGIAVGTLTFFPGTAIAVSPNIQCNQNQFGPIMGSLIASLIDADNFCNALVRLDSNALQRNY